MQKILIIANGASYGTESLFNALRLGIALKEQEERAVELRLFLMSDAVTSALSTQRPAEGYNIQQMLEILCAQDVPIRLCKTCADARGISELPLIEGISIGTLPELCAWTLEVDKVLTF
ncbi:DsrE/DsrF/TusD sulfur relay family protein [Dongshaea marina]|uniref:DsrE/DsrF/TusD sulfur relay family protein n=1 Tax=Dongshaea marina TaxID=2047966 RepID=UPI000D3EBDB4|nr:DsrE/DsrF/TusD sulfur relay family protein [Dongshaea marina]